MKNIKVEINGVEYVIADLNSALELGVITKVDKGFMPGTRFKRVNVADDEWILAQVDDNRCALINLVTGNRWQKPVPFKFNELTRIPTEAVKKCMDDDVFEAVVKQ